ncbi:hypothetical protein [Hugenholtzia roseola]|uniref:hypothetical protein n=1 Tax=Hugenholtzia roseola TaxID=1002 RepID=UPI0004110878|nr:hypothetical protein [Hugenholtzia roseola]
MSFFSDILQKVRLFFNQNAETTSFASVKNLRSELLEAAQQAASDGVITLQEMQMLLSLKDRLGLSEDDLEDVKYEVLTQQIEQVLEDGVVSDEELTFIEGLFEGLQLSGEAKRALEVQLKRIHALHRGEIYEEEDDFYEEYDNDIYIENEQDDEINDDYWGEDDNEDTDLAAAVFALSEEEIEDNLEDSLENSSEDESEDESEEDSEEESDES